MRPLSNFALGVVVGLALASATLVIWQSHAHSQLEPQLSDLKRALLRADEAAKRDREALKTAREDLDAIRTRESVESRRPLPVEAVAVPASSAINSALLSFLGDPVPAPPALDAKYSAEGLAAAFRSLCEARGIKIEKIGVDTSEFPFVVYGVLENGRDFFRQIDSEIRALPGYSYGASTSGRTPAGSTYFALHMTPNAAIPREHAEGVRRRLMLRVQMLGPIWNDPVR
jgi:hypothetical protein